MPYRKNSILRLCASGKATIFLNGKFVDRNKAMTSVFDEGFLYGWGLFETMRSYNDNIVYFNEHLKRIQRSCKPLDMKFPYPPDKLKKIIKKTVEINGFCDAYIRLTIWKAEEDTYSLISVKKYRPFSQAKYSKGFNACVFPFRQNENSFLAKFKTTNYLFYQLAYREAKGKRFDEAIILNNRGYLTEGSRTNIFFVKDRRLFTPALQCGCLDGVTRRVIFDLAKKYQIDIQEGNFTVQDLLDSGGVFLTNSLIGVMPLTRLEGRPIAKGFVDSITKFLIQKYNALLKNGS